MWLEPGNKTFSEVASMVVTWWIVGLFAQGYTSMSRSTNNNHLQKHLRKSTYRNSSVIICTSHNDIVQFIYVVTMLSVRTMTPFTSGNVTCGFFD